MIKLRLPLDVTITFHLTIQFFTIKMVNIEQDSTSYCPYNLYIIFEITFMTSLDWINVILQRWDILHLLSNQEMNWPHILCAGKVKYFTELQFLMLPHIRDTNEVNIFMVSADLLKVFSQLFSGEILGMTLNSGHVLQIQRKKPLCAKFEVTFISLI